jgi:type I restriction enzyme, S subunit
MSGAASTWPSATLGDLCEIVIGRTPRRDSPEYWHGTLPWVTISDLNDGIVKDTRECISSLGAAASGAPLLKAGTLLFSFKLTIGKMAIAGVDVYTNEAIAGLVPRNPPRVSTEYLRFALAGTDVADGSSHAVKGKTLNLPLLRAIRVRLPPLPKQKEIAARLSQQLDAAAHMRAAAERQAEAVQQLKMSAIDHSFGMLPSKWPMRPIGELARVVSGYAFKSAWFSDQGVRLLRNANVSQEGIDWTETVRLPEESRPEFAEYELNVGDIVLALDRPVVAAGLKVARLVEADVPSLLLQRVAAFRLSQGLDAGYLYAFLKTSAFLNAISGHEQSLGVPHISPRQVAAIRLPVPSVPEQRDIVRALDCELDFAETVATGLADQASDIGRLPAALLRSAFSGDSPDNS